ncbi:hypothetical protein SedNR2807_28350 [Citrobacter sedlakii]
MPLLFFDVPNLWSPSTPPFRFKVDGFFVAWDVVVFKSMNVVNFLSMGDGSKTGEENRLAIECMNTRSFS